MPTPTVVQDLGVLEDRRLRFSARREVTAMRELLPQRSRCSVTQTRIDCSDGWGRFAFTAAAPSVPCTASSTVIMQTRPMQTTTLTHRRGRFKRSSRRRSNVANRLLHTTVLLAFFLLGCGDDDGGTTVAALECDSEPVVMTTDDGVDFVRTPDSCFNSLPDWPYPSEYVEIDGLRQAYVDEGSADGPVVLLLHGQPSWSYLYRKMIPVLADAGYRVIAMDHLGMGRSDKPIDVDSYSFLTHYDRLERFVEELGLRDMNMFVQDWGSLIGLRFAGLNPDLFARIAVGDGVLPVIPAGVQPFPSVENPDQIQDIPSIFEGIPGQQVPFFNGCESLLPSTGDFGAWIEYSMTSSSFRASEVVEALTWFDLPQAEEAAYDAPFPRRIYMGGPRTFPSLVNELGGLNDEAWEGLTSFERPFLTLWAANDPGNLGQCATQQQLIDSIPGAAGQPHDRLAEASHFLQDDRGLEIARRLAEFFGNQRAGLEIIEIQSPNSLRAWISHEITRGEFDALELPEGWLKNQPRTGDPDAGRFLRSPDAEVEGEYLDEELFGFEWRHSATVTEPGIVLDEQGLLIGSTVRKFHEVTFRARRTMYLLVSPEGEVYFRIGRDANRQSDAPSLPDDWQLVEYTTPDELVILLAEQNLVIRTDNQDSFQGPVPELAGLP